MRLWEMRPGESGVIVDAPGELRALLLTPGTRISVAIRRPALVVVDASGARFALPRTLARRVIVRPSPT